MRYSMILDIGCRTRTGVFSQMRQRIESLVSAECVGGGIQMKYGGQSGREQQV
jgi:hypothetical protein